MVTTEDYIFFWREYLSQWDMNTFKDNAGVEYTCAEQYMMAKKAILFGDTIREQKIMDADHPRDMQKLGRLVTNFDPNIWAANAMQIVYQGNMYKFTDNPQLLEGLLITRGRTLVEASPYDKVWGIGLDEDSPLIHNHKTWKGANWLGYTLTSLRDNYFKV